MDNKIDSAVLYLIENGISNKDEIYSYLFMIDIRHLLKHDKPLFNTTWYKHNNLPHTSNSSIQLMIETKNKNLYKKLLEVLKYRYEFNQDELNSINYVLNQMKTSYYNIKQLVESHESLSYCNNGEVIDIENYVKDLKDINFHGI